MTTISPLLQNRISTTGANKETNKNTNNHHEKIYQDLQKRAHIAKPNEAKARLVEEGMLGNPITATKDMFKDAKNFFKTIKTGQMGDNNLGRINDLGLKIGALLIASFLAVHSKTKKESLMRFIGGATFVGMMDLWPKLFINIPARLVHGFRIDRKYISAQGDKKDFFLDNQFLVWDAYPEEQLRKDAQKAGIDYDSENGKEKIQRKMQKTALQNRTLWMATAGFATPLLTATIGNYIEPKLEHAIVEHDVEKTKGIFNGKLDSYLDGKVKKSRFAQKLSDSGIPQKIKSSKLYTIISNHKAQKAQPTELDSLLTTYKNSQLDDNFFQKLAQALSPVDYLQNFKDMDDATPFKEWTPRELIEELEKAQKQLKSFDKDDLAQQLQGAKIKFRTIEQKEIDEIIASLGDNLSQERVEEVLKNKRINPNNLRKILENTKADNSGFFKFIKELNDGPVTQLRNRSKAYLDLANPIIGSKAESAMTLEFNKTMSKVLKSLGLDDLSTLKKLRQENTDESMSIISKAIQNAVASCVKEVEVDGQIVKQFDEAQYKAFIQSLNAGSVEESIAWTIDKLKNPENIAKIMPKTDEINGVDITGIKKALIGAKGSDKGLFRILADYIETKQIDIEAIKSKAVLCANFERRALDMPEVEAGILRKVLYDGTISTAANNGYVANEDNYRNILKKFFDAEQFKLEMEALPEINLKNTVEKLGKVFIDAKNFGAGNAYGTATKNYMSCGSFAQHIKKFATNLSNNKTWMKTFAPMTVALIAITLLVQPLFGNIKKEFPEEGKGGNK